MNRNDNTASRFELSYVTSSQDAYPLFNTGPIKSSIKKFISAGAEFPKIRFCVFLDVENIRPPFKGVNHPLAQGIIYHIYSKT